MHAFSAPAKISVPSSSKTPPLQGRGSTTTPTKHRPQFLSLRRSSYSFRLSEEEAGRRCCARGEESDPGTPVTPVRSPVTPARLFHDDDHLGQGSLLQRLILLSLFVLSLWAWQPVVLWAMRRFWGASNPPSSEFGDVESLPHVHAFHESGCSGESITVISEADLCPLFFPSGIPAKDNVASVLLDGLHHELRVFATCRIAERPANEMLLETISQQGCVDLKYPLCANLQLRQLPTELSYGL